ncbi:glycosyltransferase [Acidobacteriota bacterium]
MKKILLVIYNFPPLGGPRSFRWLNLTKSLRRLGWEIDVLTTAPSSNDNFYDASLLNGFPDDIRIVRSYPGIYYSFIHRKSRPIQGFPKTTVEWLPFGFLKVLSSLSKKDYSLIISSGLPFVGHLLGFLIKKFYGLPWIADYGDPLGFNPLTSQFKRKVGFHIEKAILRSVDGIIVPFDEMGDGFVENYPYLKNKTIRSIGNGIPEYLDEITPSEFPGKFAISYVGSFYKNVHEPYEFFKALVSLKERRVFEHDVEIVIAGNTEDRYIQYADKMGLGSWMKFLGQISFDNAVSLLKGAAVNLYVGGNRKDYHFPSKLLVCAAASRPILAIRQSDTDLGSDFVEKHHIGFVVPNVKSDIEKALGDMYGYWKRGALQETFQTISTEEFSWNSRGGTLSQLLKSIIEEKGK